MNAREAALARTSWSKVTEAAPTRDELVPLIEAAGRVADHSSLRPWRLIELRGDDRLTLGAALAEAAGDDKPSTKPLRASLLIAIVASYRKTDKVPRWEQEAVASGVAHTLSLLLDEAGWGVIWRTGGLTRAEAVARAHGLHENEELLGWLYVGGKPEGKSAGRRKPVDVDTVLTRMPDAGHEGDEQPPTSTDKKKSKKKKHKKKSKKD
ncbi:nitroreductase family protein [Microbacterium esteraromaticum]|uniref:Putative NAD(P)H nitroreductase n=1 Tax=Microbacterium esteraromaticum TaxID=57043 RepID=A0A939IW63_9MICO|nr:nitroreductase family protein [Microbacterium esteraromaticum]MBN8206799.1 nitroreductase family protein [Microbacterium esteraromaticum]MBN8416954.1 nitroreductase family protein [Microbacterium esteraromaticum]